MRAHLNCKNTGEQPFDKAVPTEEVRRQLLGGLPSLLIHLFPNGKIRHGKFHVGNIQGERGESMKIELKGDKAGMWQDFATGEGGDIFELWARKKNFDTRSSFPELIADMTNWLGIYVPSQTMVKSSPKASVDEVAANDDLGTPTAKWNYTDIDSKTIATVFRYDPKGRSKQFRPYDAINKVYKAPETNRPLYNQSGIAKSESIILVEGEKCAQALIDQGICATTAMFGAKAPLDKTDWSPLKGKEVIIWPDNDEVGKNYAQSVYEKLIQIGVQSVKIIDVPEDKLDKWDAADAVAENVDVKTFIEQAKFIDITDIINTSTIANDNDNKIEHIYDKDLIGTPPEMEWVIPDWLPKGEVSAIYGDGGVGKSLLAQQLMSAVATGKEWLGFKSESKRVYALLCEDKKDEIHRRQHKINLQLGITEADFGNMLFVSRVGKDNLLMKFDKEDQGKLTKFFDHLLEDIKKFKPELVILDTLADLFAGNENVRTQARQFVQNCCGIIAREVNAAVLVCAHPSDSGIQRKTGTGGSTAWNNTFRARWYFARLEDENASSEMRELSLKKSNYSASQTKIAVRWDNGIFIRDDEYKPSTSLERRINKFDDARDKKSNEILNLIYDSATAGDAYTMSQFAEIFEGGGTKYGLGSKRTIQNRLDVLATKGFIKFFQNGEDYGLAKLPRSKCGYICIKHMRLPVTGKGEILVQPTHFKCRQSGNIEVEKCPKTWVYNYDDCGTGS